MKKCRACNHKIHSFFDLGKMPLVNSFLTENEVGAEPTYKLATAYCPGCHLVQLTETVPPEDLFRNYVYFSSTSTSLLEHFKKTADDLAHKLGLAKGDRVVEIASNDGALLQYFKEKELDVLGVDPAENIAHVANERGLPTRAEFFTTHYAQQLAREGLYADLVYGANVLAHVPDIVDFLTGVATILKSHGSAVFEFPYIKGLFENKFDTIYHEHVFYYSLIALQNLFTRANLEIYDVEATPIQGGALRIYAGHKGEKQVTDRVRDLAHQEYESGYDRQETYETIRDNVNRLREQLISTLEQYRNEGKTVAAYGAPAKGNILLNYFGIGSYIDFIVDKAETKQGRYTPGTHMLVHPPEKIYRDKPDVVLILAWNIAEEIKKQIDQHVEYTPTYIVPVPKVQTI